MSVIVDVKDLTKTYANGFHALKNVNLQIQEGEIIALLGPNGAGKTTLISTICGITKPTSGSVSVNGHDIIKNYRKTRKVIGLVPQDTFLEMFETVKRTVSFSRGLFGEPKDDAVIDEILRQLSLHDKRDNKIMQLSGGMKRRVLIAKALAHNPSVLFLDEPTAGVDVELRKEMWDLVRDLKSRGVTIILTTHYIEEAEAMADRIGIINNGQISLVEEKEALIKRLGKKSLIIEFQEPITETPASLSKYDLIIENGKFVYQYDTHAEKTGILSLLNDVRGAGLYMTDLQTSQSTLEEIFVTLVKESA